MREGAKKRFAETKAATEHMHEKLKHLGEEVEKSAEVAKHMAAKVRAAAGWAGRGAEARHTRRQVPTASRARARRRARARSAGPAPTRTPAAAPASSTATSSSPLLRCAQAKERGAALMKSAHHVEEKVTDSAK